MSGRAEQRYCFRRNTIVRDLSIGLVTIMFIGILCIHLPEATLRLQAWFQSGHANDGRERERIMERQGFRNTELGHELPWFMKGGVIRPSPSSRVDRKLWPVNGSDDDRIVEQLMYVPPGYTSQKGDNGLKTILLRGRLPDFHEGRRLFVRDQCPVDTCQAFVLNDSRPADAILFPSGYEEARPRDPREIWIFYALENPVHVPLWSEYVRFNWTATYRRDSVIVTPYEKFVPFDAPVKKLTLNGRNFAKNKTKLVAWFVSDCRTPNMRMEYAKELAKYVQVDIYGSCGPLKCPHAMSEQCFRMLDEEYKFYLAFESVNCRDYITEKLYNALRHNVVPIVMGASPEEYRRAAPYHSYIHVDDFETPKDLAKYLGDLDRSDDLYNEYFAWKGTGEFINTFFWCRLCAMLHAPPPVAYGISHDIFAWWGDGACRAPKRVKT
ncbi:glycoprotein 3-alpha-L-fucosyltransferase A-like isoform X2 [Ornithodoros turicata]